MKSITTLKLEDLKGKKVLVRLDLNVPVQDGVVTNDFRIVSSLPTIKYLQQMEAIVTVIAHCEVNKGKDEKCTLKPAAEKLGEKLGVEVKFVNNINEAKKTREEGELGLIVIENLRDNAGEKENSDEFARELASLGDIYVNDAFSVSHRAHASIVGVPKIIPGFAGIQLEKEVNTLSKAFNPPKPFVFILGGAKFETKIPLIKKFLDKADKVFVGGALANDLIKSQGYQVGKSLVSDREINLKSIQMHPNLIPVTDVVVGTKEAKVKKLISEISPDDVVSDIGPDTMKSVESTIRDATFVLWNGPLGNTESGFDEATVSLAQAIASSHAESILGGGDTLGAIESLGLSDHFTFISTGGGATLDFLAEGSLVGIDALK